MLVNVYEPLLWYNPPGSEQQFTPALATSWSVSDDALTWTFKLRDGLKFHDGADVTSDDVIASLKRWGARDGMGQQLMGAMGEMVAVDASTFQFKLKDPLGLVLESIGKISSNVPFIMPKRVADTDPFKQIDDYTGSGPFVFVKEEWVPGSKVVYKKFADYKPRSEAPDAASGGKIAKVDRVHRPIRRSGKKGVAIPQVADTPAPFDRAHERRQHLSRRDHMDRRANLRHCGQGQSAHPQRLVIRVDPVKPACGIIGAMPRLVEIKPHVGPRGPGKAGPIAKIAGAVMIVQRIAQFDHFRQHDSVEIGRCERRAGGQEFGVVVFRRKSVHGHVRIPMRAQAGAPAELAGEIMPRRCKLRQHRGHVPSDQRVSQVIHVHSRIRRWQRCCIERTRAALAHHAPARAARQPDTDANRTTRCDTQHRAPCEPTAYHLFQPVIFLRSACPRATPVTRTPAACA